MARRPGSDAAGKLFASSDVASWVTALGGYPEAVACKAGVAPKTTTKDLVKLESWWRDELPTLIKTQGFLSSDQLCKTVEWKLKRGRSSTLRTRPPLQEKVTLFFALPAFRKIPTADGQSSEQPRFKS